YDAVIDHEGDQVVRPANTSTDSLVNARIESSSRRLNYNNRDNFALAENRFYTATVNSALNENWSLRNETYGATQEFDWRNTERNVWNPVTELVDRSSFFLIYRDDKQIGNRLDLIWTQDLFKRPNQMVFGTLIDDNEQIRNSDQIYPRI